MKMTTEKWLVATLLTGTLALAVPVAFSHETGSDQKEHCMRDDKGDRFERHQADLHDALKLTAEQEAAWKTFAGKVTPPPRPDREAFEKERSQPAPARMEAMLTRMKTHEQQLAANLAAVKEFYAVLTPEQQKVFDDEFGPRGPRRPPEAP